MKLNLRTFIQNLFGAGAVAAMPPLPTGWHEPIRSPKHIEHLQSLGKPLRVVIQTAVHPQAHAPWNAHPLASTVTNMRASIHVDGSNVTIDWTGGSAPFVVVHRFTESDPWTEIYPPTMKRTVTIPLINTPVVYFIIQEQVPLLTGERTNNLTHLEWRVPELA